MSPRCVVKSPPSVSHTGVTNPPYLPIVSHCQCVLIGLSGNRGASIPVQRVVGMGLDRHTVESWTARANWLGNGVHRFGGGINRPTGSRLALRSGSDLTTYTGPPFDPARPAWRAKNGFVRGFGYFVVVSWVICG